MALFPLLESAQNPKIKQVLELTDKPKERRDARLFAVEGFREVSMALSAGFEPHTLFYLPRLHPQPEEEFSLPSGIPCYPVSPTVYSKIAYRDNTEGILAIMHQRQTDIAQLSLTGHPLILVAEAIEKPGNIGALLRTAEAAQIDAVLVCDPLCDLYNPNLIRASLGALFNLRVVACPSTEAVVWLQQQGIDIYAATLQDSIPYYQPDYKTGCAFVVGSEAQGLSPVWRKGAKACIHIPMGGAVDSLNVSVSAAILVFEAVRQRTCGV